MSRGITRRTGYNCLLVATVAACLTGSPCFARTIYVDGRVAMNGDGSSWAKAKKTIQGAVNIASSNDEVWIAEGTYAESIIMKNGVSLIGGFSGNEVSTDSRILSANPTLIDASTARGGQPAFHVIQLSGLQSAKLDGLIIRGGNAPAFAGRDGYGGGILLENCGKSVSIISCTITGNKATLGGAGICCSASSPRLENCTIESNHCAGYPANEYETPGGSTQGGGIYCTNQSTMILERCRIRGNITQGGNGDVFDGGAPPNASAPNAGKSPILVPGGSGYGGGIALDGGSTLLALSNRFEQNQAIMGSLADGQDAQGGGLYLGQSSATVANCLFIDNSITGYDMELPYSHSQGSAAYIGTSSATLVNCTISGNRSHNYGDEFETIGAFYLAAAGSPSIINCIFESNKNYAIQRWANPQKPVIRNCLFYENKPADYHDPQAGALTGAAQINTLAGTDTNVTGRPLFYDKAGGNYRLLNGSAALDRGDVSAAPAGDYDGKPRPGEDGSVDIGAFEQIGIFSPDFVYSGPILYVKADAAGTLTGDNWQNAFTLLRQALTVSAEFGIAEIHVAKGTYHERVSMTNGLTLKGGYAGLSENESPNPTVNPTILNADSGASPGLTALPQGNFVVVFDKTDDARIEGFTLTGGRADESPSPDVHGGGVHLENARNCFITDCVIQDNRGLAGGGVRALSSEAVITNCSITSNSASAHVEPNGGGLYCVESSITLQFCQLTVNRADWEGGGACFTNGAVTLSDCVVSENVGRTGGLSFQNYGGATAIIRNSEIRGNTGIISGGIHIPKGLVEKCKILSNTGGYCGGIWANETLVRNCVIAGNTGNQCAGYFGRSGGALVNSTVANNIVPDDSGEKAGVIYFDINCSPIRNCILANNKGPAVSSAQKASLIYCLFNNNQGGDYYDQGKKQTFTGTAALSAHLPFALGVVDGDPKFAGSTLGGSNPYRLNSGSPAIDAGRNTSPAQYGGVTEDILGVRRSFNGTSVPRGDGSDFDIGAYEFAGQVTGAGEWLGYE